MADEKHTEDLTPTPTQAEMDEIMAKLTGAEAAPKKQARDAKNLPDPVATPPHMTQAENDAAMALATPGDNPPDELNPLKREAKQKEEEKRKKDMEAQQHADYQTRQATPVKK